MFYSSSDIGLILLSAADINNIGPKLTEFGAYSLKFGQFGAYIGFVGRDQPFVVKSTIISSIFISRQSSIGFLGKRNKNGRIFYS